MDRRVFLKIGAGLITFSVACSLDNKKVGKRKYSITIDSNRKIGHLARKAIDKATSKLYTTDVLVVGGGIAGLAAANSLTKRESVICEMGSRFGGTSSAVSIGNNEFAQGAHYDLSYPSNFGEEGLKLLEKLNIIEFNSTLNRWDFQDKKYLIKASNEEQCYTNGKWVPTVLVNSEIKNNFISLLQSYSGKMPLPSTHISPEFNTLDQTTFAEYLNKYLPVTSDFMEAIDYQMLDDYGGSASEISALAGIHYYKCRPYFNKPDPELFSPMEGNYYFIKKMIAQLKPEQLKLESLVVALNKTNNKWLVDVWEINNNRKVTYQCNNVVYSGQKHLLKYLLPEAHATFSDVSYAPWVVINIELENEPNLSSFWQNDYLSKDAQFLGFVNSRVQSEKGNRVLTAYYCYPGIYDNLIQNIESDSEEITRQTIGYMSTYYKIDLEPFVKQVYIKLLGHAMPIPKPGYLSKDRKLEQNGISFAGVDTGRLPLMFDALDSGIVGAGLIKHKKYLKKPSETSY